jgi:hypothetical protein
VTQRGLYPRSAYDALGYQLEFDQSDPNVFVRRNLPRQFPFVAAGAAVPTTGKLLLSRITLAPGDKITTVNFLTGTTASATQTSGFVGLWSPAGARLAVSADFGSTVLAASVWQSKALSAAYTTQEGGLFYVGLCVAATTMETLVGMTHMPPLAAIGESSVAFETTATYTTPASAPATLPALTARADVPLFVLS